MYRYVLWDMDGTIANTYEGIRNCVDYALDHFGMGPLEDEEYNQFIGPPLRVSIPAALGFDEETTERAIALFRERYVPIGVYECTMFPGVREAMERLADGGMVQSVASSKVKEMCQDVLDKFGISDLMDYVVGATMDGRIDSKIQVLEEAFRVISQDHPDFDKSQVILIGDTRYDAMGAQQAGIDCVGIEYGFGTREELEENGVLAVFKTLDQVCDFILDR